jgi:hypothetical protein
MSDISEALGQDFDTSSVEPMEGFDAITPGWYPLEITAAAVKKTKKNDGSYLELEHTVHGDKFANRKLWKRINLANPSAKAVEIGHRELAGLGKALGLAAITDSAELVGKFVEGKVTVKKEEGREPENEIQAFRAVGAPASESPAPSTKPPTAAKPTPAATPPSAKTAPAASTKSAKRPWER